MANLLHRLLRGRNAPRDVAPAEGLAPPLDVGPEPEPAADAKERSQTDAAAKFEARRKPGGGPRRTKDEVSSIGPGEPY